MKRLGAEDPRVRLEAAEALGAAEGPETSLVIEPLVQRFYDLEALVRQAAWQGLQRIGPQVVPALRALVEREGGTFGRHDPGARAQRLAVNLLGALTPMTDEAVALAADVCEKRTIHDVVRHDACVSLAQLGQQDARWHAQAVRMLVQVFGESDADVYLRTELVDQLSGLGPDAETITAFSHALQDPEVFIRRAVAGALVGFGAAAQAALPELQAAVRDADSEVRASARRAIEHISRSGGQSDGPSAQPIVASAR